MCHVSIICEYASSWLIYVWHDSLIRDITHRQVPYEYDLTTSYDFQQCFVTRSYLTWFDVTDESVYCACAIPHTSYSYGTCLWVMSRMSAYAILHTCQVRHQYTYVYVCVYNRNTFDVTDEFVFDVTDESVTNESVLSWHIWMIRDTCHELSHGTYVSFVFDVTDESVTDESVLSWHIWMIRDTCHELSHATYVSFVFDVTDSCVTWIIHMGHETINMTMSYDFHSGLWRIPTWLTHTYVTNSCVSEIIRCAARE